MSLSRATPRKRTLHRSLDSVGMFISLGCALHCLMVPVLLMLLPFVGLGVFVEHWIEDVILASSATLALLSLCWGARVHGDLRLLALFAAAMGFFIVGGFHVTGLLEGVLIASGGACLALAHYLNRKLCMTCHDCA